MFVFKFQRVLTHEEDQSLLRAYISEWRKFFTQCSYLPMPFFQLETALQGKTHSSVQKKPQQNTDDSLVRKVKFIVIHFKTLCLFTFCHLAHARFLELEYILQHQKPFTRLCHEIGPC